MNKGGKVAKVVLDALAGQFFRKAVSHKNLLVTVGRYRLIVGGANGQTYTDRGGDPYRHDGRGVMSKET